ncbi:hypothetical protein F5050DRAFT_1195867 [Lentinula boryana]|uniref:Uncharacterized protein n=1 Tax=Lentinula boryana TaxID=40481 RepID=A0ABQ8PZB2_9AGAR|nr:hypothetical protein F5050DRAFT_1195867 [Lentinula boryana]
MQCSTFRRPAAEAVVDGYKYGEKYTHLVPLPHISPSLLSSPMKLSGLVLTSTFLGASLVNATAWVAGYQSSGYTGWNLRQYTYLYEGNPREAAYLSGSDENTLPGAVCNYWTEWNIIGNSNPGDYQFNCVATSDEINNNARNNGFYVGGLNHEGVTVALCHIEYSGSELCDSDTVTDADERACNVWVVCE